MKTLKTDSRYFFKDLVTHSMTLENLLTDQSLFERIPDNWYVIVVDVENSTQAIKHGLHQEVNLAATGSIIAVLNKIKAIDTNLRIPYFFGGDGATFIVPGSVLQEILSVLESYRYHVKKNMFLSLKVGSLPVSKVYQDNRMINIAKLRINTSLTIPVVLGTGLKKAEQIIKSFFIDETASPEQSFAINLEGMECRWQEIPPPNEKEKVVCLLVNCDEDHAQAQVYQKIMYEISRIFGKYQERQPISIFRLKLDLSYKKIRQEMYARIGKFNLWYLLKNWFITILGKYYFKYFKSGKEYVQKVSQQSNTLMMDGMINTIIAGTQEKIDRLTNFLNELEVQNKIIYGIHVTHGSIMSCYVEDRKTEHIHFVDGTNGGYTEAAKMFKPKVKIANLQK